MLFFSRVLRDSTPRYVDWSVPFLFFWCFWALWAYCSCPYALVTFSSTAPAHPHATGVSGLVCLMGKKLILNFVWRRKSKAGGLGNQKRFNLTHPLILIQQISQRVNQTETSVLADLEGLEGRRQEQVSDIVTKFEDRFKHHMVDLLFLEKLGRWLTNTQVIILNQARGGGGG